MQITSGGSSVGILLGIAAAVDYAIYILLGSRIVRRSGSIGSTAVIIASTAGVYAIIAPVHGLVLPASRLGWVAVFAIALVSTVLSFVTFFAGLGRIGPTTASTLSTFEPIVAVALAAIVLGETITAVQALGGTLILIAVVILSRNEMRRSKQQPPQEDEDSLAAPSPRDIETQSYIETEPELLAGGKDGH
jgi:drug/metabolite transporter (DMT)-like permease